MKVLFVCSGNRNNGPSEVVLNQYNSLIHSGLEMDMYTIKGRGLIGYLKNNTLLKLPHPRSHSRNFVLYPIKEIDPKWVHPVFKKNVDFLINELSQNSRIEITRLRKSVII